MQDIKKRNEDIKVWDIEDPTFWKNTGKAIANRNMIISIICLLLSFSVWMYWTVIVAQMKNLGFRFTSDQLLSLVAIAGFSGATLRIPSTFFIRIAGGRNTTFITTIFLLVPTLGTGVALMNPDTPLWEFQLFALFGGIGGGNFSASMSNITFFYPKRMQGFTLGLNGGIGNFGVTTMQVLIPVSVVVGFVGGSMPLVKTSGTIVRVLPIGTNLFLQNAAFIWVALLIPAAALAWGFMNNIVTKDVSPHLEATSTSFTMIGLMTILGLVVAFVGLLLLLPSESNGLFEQGLPWYIVIPVVVIIMMGVLFVSPHGVGKSIKHQAQIFKNPHTWILTLLYVMSFGSFIGFAGVFGLSMNAIFSVKHILAPDGINYVTIPNPNGPPVLSYVWLGPFVGALIRPLGGIISDKIGGSLVTALMTFLMIVYALGAGYYMYKACHSATPEEFFMPFFIIFCLLFCATGVANASVFRTGAVIFDSEQAGPLLGWIAAIAAYGSYIIPKIISAQIKAGTPENAMIGLSIFYGICLIITIVCYLRVGVKHLNA